MKIRFPRSRRSIAVAGLVGVAAIVTGVAIWSSFFAAPSKQDYQRAVTQARGLKSAQVQSEQATTKYVQAIVASLRLDPTAAKLKDDTKTALADYDEAFDRYDRLLRKVVSSPATRDKEVKEAMDAAETQAETFKRVFADLTDIYPALYATYISCDDVQRFTPTGDESANFKEFDTRSKDCIGDLKKLASTDKLKSIAEYAKKRVDIVNEQRSAYETLTKPDANRAVVAKRMGELAMQTRMLDPLTLVQSERAKATDTSAVDRLITLLDRKTKG